MSTAMKTPQSANNFYYVKLRNILLAHQETYKKLNDENVDNETKSNLKKRLVMYDSQIKKLFSERTRTALHTCSGNNNHNEGHDDVKQKNKKKKKMKSGKASSHDSSTYFWMPKVNGSLECGQYGGDELVSFSAKNGSETKYYVRKRAHNPLSLLLRNDPSLIEYQKGVDVCKFMDCFAKRQKVAPEELSLGSIGENDEPDIKPDPDQISITPDLSRATSPASLAPSIEDANKNDNDNLETKNDGQIDPIIEHGQPHHNNNNNNNNHNSHHQGKESSQASRNSNNTKSSSSIRNCHEHRFGMNKADFFRNLDLVSRAESVEIVSTRKNSRKRRTTANPQFSSAALEAKRVTKLEIIAERKQRRALAAAGKQPSASNSALPRNNVDRHTTNDTPTITPTPTLTPTTATTTTTTTAPNSSSSSNSDGNTVISTGQKITNFSDDKGKHFFKLENKPLFPGLYVVKKITNMKYYCKICMELCQCTIDTVMVCNRCSTFFHLTCVIPKKAIIDLIELNCPCCSSDGSSGIGSSASGVDSSSLAKTPASPSPSSSSSLSSSSSTALTTTTTTTTSERDQLIKRLNELRKYILSLTLANQFLQLLGEMRQRQKSKLETDINRYEMKAKRLKKCLANFNYDESLPMIGIDETSTEENVSTIAVATTDAGAAAASIESDAERNSESIIDCIDSEMQQQQQEQQPPPQNNELSCSSSSIDEFDAVASAVVNLYDESTNKMYNKNASSSSSSSKCDTDLPAISFCV